MALASLQPTINVSGREKVYVAALPFRATTEPFQSVTSALHILHLWDLRHFVVIIKTSSPPSNRKAILFYFQPSEPQNVFALALVALTGGSVPGAFLRRKLTRLPKQRCWFVGCVEVDSLVIALKFNDTRETDWRMGIHDRRNYADGLVERLTGEKHVLEPLRRHIAWLI